MTYTVVAGDTIESIAQKFQISKEQLMRLNPIYGERGLAVGDVLIIGEEINLGNALEEVSYCGEQMGILGQGSSCGVRDGAQGNVFARDNMLDYTKPTPAPPGFDMGGGVNRPTRPNVPIYPNRPNRPPNDTIVIGPSGNFWPNYDNQVIVGRPEYGEPNLDDVNYSWQEGRELRYLLFTDRYRYREGEKIRISFRKRNISNQTLALRYPTGQLFDFYISDERGMEIWRWSDENISADVEREIVLAPKQSESMTIVWDQRTKNGYRVPAQRLTIWGVNHASEIAIPLEIQIY